MGRVLAVDWGTRRVGVAVSDETRSLARTLPTLNVISGSQTVEKLVALARELQVDTVVLGFPVHMSGREGEGAQRVLRLAAKLEELLPGLRILTWDERLTSHQAEEILRERGERLRGNKGRLDQVAAAVLLQCFLDAEGR
jgi:putative Holliday junction resolvase